MRRGPFRLTRGHAPGTTRPRVGTLSRMSRAHVHVVCKRATFRTQPPARSTQNRLA